MRRPLLLLALPAALALAGCGDRDAAQTAATPAADAPAEHTFSPAINGEDFGEMVRMLATDEFEGRAPGTAGEDKTVEYIKAQFERIGLQPGGDPDVLANGDEIVFTQPAVDLIQLVGKYMFSGPGASGEAGAAATDNAEPAY